MTTRQGLRSPLLALLALLTLLPPVAGCALLSEAPQRQLYRLTPSFGFPAGLPHSRAQLLVTPPTAPAGLDSRRIALSRSPVTLDYYADGEWSDRAPFLVQDVLVAGFQQSGALPAVAPERSGLSADYILDTVIDDFEAVYDSPKGAPTVRVALSVKLVKVPTRKIIAHTVIRSEQRAAANRLPAIVRAFDGALSGAARQVVVWTVGNRALSPRRRSAR